MQLDAFNVSKLTFYLTVGYYLRSFYFVTEMCYEHMFTDDGGCWEQIWC